MQYAHGLEIVDHEGIRQFDVDMEAKSLEHLHLSREHRVSCIVSTSPMEIVKYKVHLAETVRHFDKFAREKQDTLTHSAYIEALDGRDEPEPAK